MDACAGRARAAQNVRAFVVALAAFTPILGTWVYKEWVRPRPFWIHYYDAETLYYHAGRELLAGALPHNLDNPGTPVQVLSALLLRASGTSPERFETFRMLAHLTALCLALGAAVLLTRTVFVGLPSELQACAVWAFYCCPQSLEYSNVWSPEILYFPVGVLVVVALWNGVERGPSPRALLLAGACIGLCCAVKFTFLAWIPALVLGALLTTSASGLERARSAGAAVLGVVVGFLLATAAAWEGYGYMFRWLVKLGTHAGAYGSGPAAPPSLRLIGSHWLAAVTSAKGWHLWLVVCLLLAARATFGGSVQPRTGRRLIFWVAVLAMAGSYLLVSRHFALRYLLPTAFGGVLLLRVSADRDLARSRLWRTALALGTALLLGKHIAANLATHEARIQQGLSLNSEVAQFLRRVSPGHTPVVLYSFRFPQPSYALRMDAQDQPYLDAVERLHPAEGHYDPWLRRLYVPSGSEWDYLVLADEDVEGVPVPTGPIVARIGEVVVLSRPVASGDSPAGS